MAVAVIADISYVVVARSFHAEGSGPHNESVGVENEVIFAITIVDHGTLGDESLHREVLPVKVCDEHVIVAKVFGEIVQTTVGLFIQPPEPGEVVLEDVVVAIAKQANAKLVVLEQEATEIR